MRIPFASMLVSTVALAGCFGPPTYPVHGPANVTPADRAIIAANEAYYLDRAREQAAFASGCDAGAVTTAPLSRAPAPHLAYGNPHRTLLVLEDAERLATTIGAVACGQRLLFQVVCGPHQSFGAVAEKPYGSPCDVVPSDGAFKRIGQNGEVQKQIDDEAAAAAAAATAVKR